MNQTYSQIMAGVGKDIIELHNSGYGYRKISEILGVSTWTIRKVFCESCREKLDYDLMNDKVNAGIEMVLHGGKTYREISKELGLNYSYFQKECAKRGIKKPLTKLQYDVKQLKESGLSCTEIANRLNKNNSTIRYTAIQIGIPFTSADRTHKQICPMCGTEFYTDNYSVKCCSELCRKRLKSKRSGNKRIKPEQNIDKDITLEKLFKRDNGKCYICGKQCDWNDIVSKGNYHIIGKNYPTVEHVIPLSKGGTHSWENVKLACFECNVRKGNR